MILKPASKARLLNHRRFCYYLLWRDSSDTLKRFLPLARRAANTLLPFAELIRSLNPCLFLLFLCEGWNVLFMTLMLILNTFYQSIPKKRNAKITFISQFRNKLKPINKKMQLFQQYASIICIFCPLNGLFYFFNRSRISASSVSSFVGPGSSSTTSSSSARLNELIPLMTKNIQNAIIKNWIITLIKFP